MLATMAFLNVIIIALMKAVKLPFMVTTALGKTIMVISQYFSFKDAILKLFGISNRRVTHLRDHYSSFLNILT